MEFHPLLEDKNSLVLFLLPPPPLHLLLLGQGNKLWETLENICIQRFGKNIQNNPLMKFVKKINVVKAPYHGKYVTHVSVYLFFMLNLDPSQVKLFL